MLSGAHVTSVELANTPVGVSVRFDEEFEAGVLGALQTCSVGQTPVTVRVTIDGYNAANPALALFAPAQSQISGVARLFDASGAEIGSYRIRRSFTMGGIAGAAVATGAETMMINAFGDELCEQAFEVPAG